MQLVPGDQELSADVYALELPNVDQDGKRGYARS